MPKTAKATAEQTQEKPRQSDERASSNDSQEASKKQVSAQQIDFPEAVETEAAGATSNFDILLDMNVFVTVTIGRTQIPIRRLLQLGPGSVLKLDKPIDAPADLYLKDAKFASADVVVVDGKFAVRIKQIIGTGAASSEPEA